MGLFVRLSGGMAAVALTGAALMAPSAAQAQSMGGDPTYRVPCSTSALVTAINSANTDSSATIHLRGHCAYSITIPATASDGLPLITGHITMVGGHGTVISRNSLASFRILDVAASATFRLIKVSVMNGKASTYGGGIQNAGALTLNGVTLSGNSAANGGGLGNLTNAGAVITDSDLTGNTAASVGGGGIINFGRLTVDGSVLSKNNATVNGGGLNTQPGGTSRMFKTEFVGNVSGSGGGGLSNLGTTSLTTSIVRMNKGSGGGGGIATGNTNVTLHDTLVFGNTPSNCTPLNSIAGCRN